MTNGTSGNTVSIYKSKVIQNTLNPVWNEEGIAVGFKGNNDVLVLTMFDKDLVGSDDFMGQVCSKFRHLDISNFNVLECDLSQRLSSTSQWC